MNEVRIEIHAASASLPDMAADRFAALKDSILRSGLIDAIVLWRGQVVDGRHRLRACSETGVEARYVSIPDDANPWTHAKDRNERRDLTDAQRYGWWELACEHETEWSEEQVRIRAEKAAAISEAAKDGKVGRASAKNRESLEVGDTPPTSESQQKSEHKTRHAKAKAAKVSESTVREMDALKVNRPDLHSSVMAGKMKLTAATRTMREDAKKEDLARPVCIELPRGVHRGDFRELSERIQDDSIDLIFTDPPYDAKSVALYEDAARVAARILKPGGSMIAYSGQSRLPDVLCGMSKHLRYWWTIAGVHEGGNQIMNKFGIRCGWKPLVWFVKGGRADVQNVVLDVIRGDREKFAHPWQQSQAEAEYFVRELCSEHGTVVDFFLGGGTTAAACKSVGRNFIGFEVDANAIERAAERLVA